MKKRTVVVFGGGGYVGAALVPMLLDHNFKVKVFDTFWYGTDHLPNSKNLHLVQGDVRNLDKVKQALKSNGHTDAPLVSRLRRKILPRAVKK